MGQLLFGNKPKPKPKPKFKGLTPEAKRMAEHIFLAFKLKQEEKKYGISRSKLSPEDVKRIRWIQYMKDKP